MYEYVYVLRSMYICRRGALNTQQHTPSSSTFTHPVRMRSLRHLFTPGRPVNRTHNTTSRALDPRPVGLIEHVDQLLGVGRVASTSIAMEEEGSDLIRTVSSRALTFSLLSCCRHGALELEIYTNTNLYIKVVLSGRLRTVVT